MKKRSYQKRILTFIGLFFFAFSFNLLSQNNSYKAIFRNDSLNKDILKKISPAKNLTKDQLNKSLQKSLLDLYDLGYVAASFDSVVYRNDSALITFNLGFQYVVKNVDLSEINSLFLRSVGIRDKDFKNMPFNNKLISEAGLALIKYAENNGYPFAKVFISEINFKDGFTDIKLKMNEGPVIKIKDIVIHGDSKINAKYLHNYLGINVKDIYNEKIIANIDNRLRELAFLTLKNPTALSLTDQGAIVHLFIENKKASTFNGVVGVLPNNTNTAGATKQTSLAFTGDITMHLANILKQGEVADLKWRGLPNQTQELDLKMNYPFLFSLPVGVSGAINIFKQDTSFINYNTSLGVSYLLKGNNYLKAFWNNKGTSVNNQNTTNTTNVQNNASSYGLEFNYEKLDYRLNPTQGFDFTMSAQAGNKTIRGTGSNGLINIPIKGSDNIAVTLQIPATSILYNIHGKANMYIPFFKITTLKLGLQGGMLSNPYLFNNDLYRIGGIKSMRGFTDASIFASQYIISTAEYRLLLERNSFVSLFIDYAYTEKITLIERVIDHPYGFGAGLSFETKAGIFSLNYAVGSQLGNPVDFSAAKIHFGFLNQF